jgi:AraC-like DNA-binding protein
MVRAFIVGFSGRAALSVLNKTHVVGYERPWPERQAADAGSLFVEVFFTPPNTRAPFHVHEEATVVVPLSGLFVENTLKTSIRGEPGVVIVETPDSPHEDIYGPLGGTNLRLRMSTELENLVSFEPHAQAGHVPIYEVARRMAEHVGDPDPLLLECAGLEILGFVKNGPGWAPRGRRAYLRDVIADVRANICSERGIAEIARSANVSPIRLVRSFRKAYGISLARFMRVSQLQRALSLLCDPMLPISAVAAETGFSDQSHMTRAFARIYGLTPAALRRSRRAS